MYSSTLSECHLLLIWFTHVSMRYLHEQAQYEGPAVCPSRGGALNCGHHFSVAGRAANACGSAANWHQVRCGRCLNNNCRLWWQRLVRMMRWWLRHGWIQWRLCGSTWIRRLIGLCGCITHLRLRHLAVRWWLLAIHVDLAFVLSFWLFFALSRTLSLSLDCSLSRSFSSIVAQARPHCLMVLVQLSSLSKSGAV